MATKNLLGNRAVYNRYFGDFRGVDFSSDHTQVNEARLSYLVNMYRDYQSGQGKALETVPGFRRRVNLPGDDPVYAIYSLDFQGKTHVLIHAGNRLYCWHNYPSSIAVEMSASVFLPAPSEEEGGIYTYVVDLPERVHKLLSVITSAGEDITYSVQSFDKTTHTMVISRSDLSAGDNLSFTFYEGEIREEDILFEAMERRRSVSFLFNNRLYILDGKHYLVYDGQSIKSAVEDAYIPTTYINIIPEGENADIGTEYEQRNMLTPLFRHTFIADGTAKDFYLNEKDLDAVDAVKVYGEVISEGYTVDLAQGKISFDNAPPKPQDATGGVYPEFYAGVEIVARKRITAVSGVTDERENIYELITECTIATVFDNRVFFSGNPAYPNHIFYCGRNQTGYVDPTYFGVLNYMQDGVGLAPVTGMIPVADTLMVLKSDTKQDGSVYFHSPHETGIDLQPKIYPSTQGLSGIGCLGHCVNFLDDPIFVSRLGIEAVGQLSVRYERAIEHRSSMIDAKLLRADLSEASLEEWGGYLLVLVDGCIYMADSRQKYVHEIGVPQYEWYYLEGIGVWDRQYPEYRYSNMIWDELEGKAVSWCPVCGKGALKCECGSNDGWIHLPLKLADEVYNAETNEVSDLRGSIVNEPQYDGTPKTDVFFEVLSVSQEGISYSVPVFYTVREIYDERGEFVRYDAYLCDETGARTGGVFRPATVLRAMDDNVFFGTESGVVCSFNFDMRSDVGDIPHTWYTFDNRTIFSGCATKMDNCGIPGMTKSTVKKSTVIKTRAAESSAAKIKVRTNRKPYEQIARINNTRFSFESLDFSDVAFVISDQSLFAIKEKEKKWVEKQYFIYSDEYMKPFALFYISYRYQIAGRYKE
jgi:hypothetical protein